MAHVLTRLGDDQIVYRLVQTAPEIRRCPVNKHLQLYYRPLGHNELELLAFFDTRQAPGKLRL